MPGVDVTRLDDGRLRLVASQSWVGTYLSCPEQARLELVGQLPRTETDATAIGTAVHAGIESVLRDGLSHHQASEHALETYGGLHDLGINYVQVAKRATAEAHVQRCFDTWYEELYPTLPDPMHVEWPFNLHLGSDEYAEYWVKGTIDLIDDNWEPWDWKNPGRAYEEWEVHRFKVQPTWYTFAAAQAATGDAWSVSEDWPFHYGIMIKGSTAKLQTITTQRSQVHWHWAVHQLTQIGRMIAADLDRWPLLDQGWHCSEKWCAAWANCKGRFVDALAA